MMALEEDPDVSAEGDRKKKRKEETLAELLRGNWMAWSLEGEAKSELLPKLM